MPREAKLAITNLLLYLDPIYARHGDCRGVDAQFHELCWELRKRQRTPLIHVHPACDVRVEDRAFSIGGDDYWEPEPPLVRNQVMVDLCDWLIAVPRTAGWVPRSGTWSTILYAQTVDVPIFYVWGDGSVSRPAVITREGDR
jgi:hypothetical protein